MKLLKCLGILIVMVLFMLPSNRTAFGQLSLPSWFVVASGGGKSTNGTLAVSGAIGQPSSKILTDGGLAVSGGFMSAFGGRTTFCGDQNDDGVVNILDVIIDTKITTTSMLASERQENLSDLNRDGVVNAEDAELGIQQIVGIVRRPMNCGSRNR